MLIKRFLLPAFCLVISLCQPCWGAAPRTTLPLDGDWKFYRGEDETAREVEFQDSAWGNVQLPHTWNNESDPPLKGYYRGPGWYRKSFVAEKAWEQKKVFVRFGGASLVAKVFLNGKELGEHRGGFAAFCFKHLAYSAYRFYLVIAVCYIGIYRGGLQWQPCTAALHQPFQFSLFIKAMHPARGIIGIVPQPGFKTIGIEYYRALPMHLL